MRITLFIYKYNIGQFYKFVLGQRLGEHINQLILKGLVQKFDLLILGLLLDKVAMDFHMPSLQMKQQWISTCLLFDGIFTIVNTPW